MPLWWCEYVWEWLLLRANSGNVLQSSVRYVVYNGCGSASVLEPSASNIGLQSDQLLWTSQTLLRAFLIPGVVNDNNNLILSPLKFYRDLILAISNFQWISFTIGVVSIVALILAREVIQPRLNKLKWYPGFPLPMALFLVCHFIITVLYTLHNCILIKWLYTSSPVFFI